MKVIVFDVARVVLDFEPLPFLRSYIREEKTVLRVFNALFKSERWLLLDRGVLLEEDAIQQICTENADIATEIQYAYTHWHSILTPINCTVAFIEECRQKRHKLYFLSNLHKSTSAFVVKEFAALWQQFEGGIFSCDTGYIKPEKEIFNLLLEKYNINASECIYIDDNIENVKVADDLGMQGVHFRSGEDLAALHNIG